MLYVVGTPIGNLEDISLRALRILGSVDFILCEDTRVTKKLLDNYNIETALISYHEHSRNRKVDQILKLLAEDKKLALVTDAGTPGISDPGGKLVQRVIQEFGEKFKIEAVPGPSAVTAALSISGLPTDKFIFMGFPPHKKGRQKFIKSILRSEFPVVIYESKHRIIKFLKELQDLAEDKVLTSIVVCRELTKMFETVYRGDISKIIEKITTNKNDQKGEFVVIVGR